MGKKTTKFFVYGLKASEIMIETYIKDLTNRKQVFKVRKTEKSLLFKKNGLSAETIIDVKY